jgi:predicted heme/steroid binding protein/uncharacterized membrane protein
LTDSQRLRRFTKRELQGFIGEEGKPVYVAFKEKVYDVSNSRLWTNGTHQGRHSAGKDLTESILNAPHNEEVLMKFPVVGELIEEEPSSSKLVQWVQKLHLHPISVHFSIAYSIAFPLLSIIYILNGENSFETASYYMLLLGFLSAPFAVIFGLFSWRVTYKGKRTSLFTWKLTLAAVLLAVTTICLAWRILNQNILTAWTELSYVYLSLAASLVLVVTALGYFGGEIVYP